MDKLSFTFFAEICRLNLQEKHVPEIFEAITTGDCIFHPSSNLASRDRIARIYNIRLQIVKDAGESGEDYNLHDFEKTVSNLGASSSPELALASLFTRDAGHLIFYIPDTSTILGILKTKRETDLQSMEENIAKNLQYYKGFQKYAKGKLVTEWK